MQHIQDNEFDRYFKDQLVDSEVQPSANLWDRIEPQIANKKKRSQSVYWAAAAIAVLALSAGLMFTQPGNQSSGVQQGTSVALNKAEAKHQEGAGLANVSEETKATERSQRVAPADLVAKLPVATHTGKQPGKENKKTLTAMQPFAATSHHSNTTPVQMIEERKGQVTDLSVAEVAFADNNTPAASSAPVAAVDAIIETYETTEIEHTTRPRIRNAGDLVNFVVDKIDKREQKLVEFRTDDDENSSLVAINIGPFKINQRKSK